MFWFVGKAKVEVQVPTMRVGGSVQTEWSHFQLGSGVNPESRSSGVSGIMSSSYEKL